jgi:uncharacterized protein (DUF2336 family)
MHLVQVDVIGAQTPERVLDRAHDPLARAAAVVGLVVHRHEELRGEDEIVAAALERLADDLFRYATGVDVGRVLEVDARVERLVDFAGFTVGGSER